MNEFSSNCSYSSAVTQPLEPLSKNGSFPIPCVWMWNYRYFRKETVGRLRRWGYAKATDVDDSFDAPFLSVRHVAGHSKVRRASPGVLTLFFFFSFSLSLSFPRSSLYVARPRPYLNADGSTGKGVRSYTPFRLGLTFTSPDAFEKTLREKWENQVVASYPIPMLLSFESNIEKTWLL